MLRALLILILFGMFPLKAQSPPAPTGTPAQEDTPPDDIVTRESPNKRFIATCREVADSDRPPNRDLDGTKLVIASASQYHSCVIPRLVNEVEWSPDSKFLVLTTSSAGGHSPWNYQSFVYCVCDNSCRRIENSTFCVVAPTIHFSGLHSVDLMASVTWHWDIDNPVSITIDLAKQSVIMKKLIGRVETGKVPPKP